MSNPNHFANKSVRQFFEEHPERFEFLREKFAVNEDDFEIYFEKTHQNAYALKIELLKFITCIIYRREPDAIRKKIWTILVVMFLNKFKENYIIRTERSNWRICDLRRLIKFIFYGGSSDLIELVRITLRTNFATVEPYTCGVCYEDNNTEAFRCEICTKAELCQSCFSQISRFCPFCRSRIPSPEAVNEFTFYHNNQPHTHTIEEIGEVSIEVVIFDRFNNRCETVPVSVLSSYEIATTGLIESIEDENTDLTGFFNYLTPEARIYFPNSQIFEYWTQNDFPTGLVSAIFHACGFDTHPEELRSYIRREIFNANHTAVENFSQFAGGYLVNTSAVLWWNGLNVIFLKNIFNSFENHTPLNLHYSSDDFFDLEITRL
jgi:hypothetical protein